MSANSDLEKKIGYTFRDGDKLSRALIHASMGAGHANNERLEFLGDRVLGLCVAEMLLVAFPQDSEGDLAKRHTALVQQNALLDVAHIWGLSASMTHLPGALTPAVEADAVEAVIGAAFLDGGYASAVQIVRSFWQPLLDKYKAPPVDPKSQLQEWAQEKGLPLPVYNVKSRSGSDHAPVFDIEVVIKGYAPASARAPSKRAAEKEAAILFLQNLGIIS